MHAWAQRYVLKRALQWREMKIGWCQHMLGQKMFQIACSRESCFLQMLNARSLFFQMLTMGCSCRPVMTLMWCLCFYSLWVSVLGQKNAQGFSLMSSYAQGFFLWQETPMGFILGLGVF